MSKNLVIVESPSKAKTINKYLGKDYLVEATIGHIRDLPRTTFGVDIENGYQPKIVTIKGKNEVIKKIKSHAQKAKHIYIATDPDREGEAIAKDISDVISNGNKNIHRVLFIEITEKGIKRGMAEPKQIDESLVNSQRARRVMDRIIGYKVSPLLWNHLFEYGNETALSAGRVQSVALRLICEREQAINSFIPIEYWSIVGTFKTNSDETFNAKLFSFKDKTYKVPDDIKIITEQDPKYFNNFFYIKSETEANQFLENCRNESYSVLKVEKKIVNRNPSAPFTTSTLQQEASKKLYFRPRQTMQIAQKLYEGIELGNEGLIGLITYMRTDSTRLNEEIVLRAREFIAVNYGTDYLPKEPKSYSKKKANVQDAHEAIRPTDLKFTPAYVKPYLTKEQFKLYELIWNRFIACQMNPAQLEQKTIDIKGGDYIFRATGSTILYKGFTIIYDENGEEIADDEQEEKSYKLSKEIFENQKLDLLDLKKNQHFTKPLPRYTESSLVKELDNLGIGRPSTYASIISTLYDRGYVIGQDRKLIPTELGIKVNNLLVEHFDHIFNVDFTAKMEKELDDIAEGKNNFKNVLDDFYIPFSDNLKEADKKLEKLKCDLCGSPMEIKMGRFGRFLACTNYPTCKNIKSLKSSNNQPIEYLNENCPKCGNQLVYRNSKFGRFIGCSKYPDCDYTKAITLNLKCPKCDDGEIIQRVTKKKKIFYGCSNYPKCDYASWDKPTDQICPNCEKDLLVKKIKNGRDTLICNSCKFVLQEEEVE
ncbi:MAG: type I DNA topoisomerase [Ignavibacteria bacterium]|nr:type I DNA topoisomerase [Ignavibacteria bacterium]